MILGITLRDGTGASVVHADILFSAIFCGQRAFDDKARLVAVQIDVSICLSFNFVPGYPFIIINSNLS